MNVTKKVSMAARVKAKHQKSAFNPFMVNSGINMMKENDVRQSLTYDDGTAAEWAFPTNFNDYNGVVM